MQTNPVLESFGNAMTVGNSNWQVGGTVELSFCALFCLQHFFSTAWGQKQQLLTFWEVVWSWAVCCLSWPWHDHVQVADDCLSISDDSKLHRPEVSDPKEDAADFKTIKTGLVVLDFKTSSSCCGTVWTIWPILSKMFQSASKHQPDSNWTPKGSNLRGDRLPTWTHASLQPGEQREAAGFGLFDSKGFLQATNQWTTMLCFATSYHPCMKVRGRHRFANWWVPLLSRNYHIFFQLIEARQSNELKGGKMLIQLLDTSKSMAKIYQLWLWRCETVVNFLDGGIARLGDHGAQGHCTSSSHEYNSCTIHTPSTVCACIYIESWDAPGMLGSRRTTRTWRDVCPRCSMAWSYEKRFIKEDPC